MEVALPLAGIRVIDCSRVLAGPFATMLLADLGADVIKIEPPSGDETRDWGPPWWGSETDRRSAYFAAVNRNKRSMAIDLRSLEGQQLLDRLADRSDLLVHNARPSSAERLGLGPERLRERHPRLVVAAVGGFAGTDTERPAYDLLAQAESGFMSITGEPDGGPMKTGVAVLDLLTGLELAVGALAALVGRGRLDAGEAQDAAAHVNVNLIEASVTGLANVLANHLAGGGEPERWGNQHPNIVPYQVFATSDGHLAIAVGNDAQFRRLVDVLAMEHEPRFATNPGRLAHRSELIARLQAAIGRRERDELVAALAEADVPAGPVNTVSQALAAMERSHDGGWTQTIGNMRLAPDPIRIDGGHLPVHGAPPLLGEHTTVVLAELGLSSADEERMRRDGVVG